MTSTDANDHLRRYINPDYPMGPLDTDLIQHREVEVRLFEANYASFDKLVSRGANVIIGRRGAGKTALLNCYKCRDLVNRDDLPWHRLQSSELTEYEFVFSTPPHSAFESLQLHVMGTGQAFRPIETVVDAWDQLVGDFILMELSKAVRDSESRYYDAIVSYLNKPETLQRLEAAEVVWGQGAAQRTSLWPFGKKKVSVHEPPSRRQALHAAEQLLRSLGKKALFVLDSLDQYQVGDGAADSTIGALLRFVRHFNLAHDWLKVKIGLPSEIFPEIQRACANPLKDIDNFEHITWTSEELARIAAHRYRIFLELYDRPAYEHQFRSLDFGRKNAVRQFWSKLFDGDVKNEYGMFEKPITYILRHTQLLPRQVFKILETLVKASHARTGGYRELKSDLLGPTIELNESVLATEIFTAYRYVFPHSERVGRLLFGNFPTTFSHEQLEEKWRRSGRPHDYNNKSANVDFIDVVDMLSRVGIIGVVPEKEPTGRYVEGSFSYNQLVPQNIGQGTSLCVHPIFSTYFKCAANEPKKTILPYGAAFE